MSGTFNFEANADAISNHFEIFDSYLAYSSMEELRESMRDIITNDDVELQEMRQGVKTIMDELKRAHEGTTDDISDLEHRLLDYSFTLYKLKLYRMLDENPELSQNLSEYIHLLFELFIHIVKGTNFEEDETLINDLERMYREEEERGRQEARGLQTPPDGPPVLERENALVSPLQRDTSNVGSVSDTNQEEVPLERNLFGNLLPDGAMEAPANILENTRAAAGEAVGAVTNAAGEAAGAVTTAFGAIQGLFPGDNQQEEDDEDFRRRLQEAQEASADLGEQQPTTDGQMGGFIFDTVKEATNTATNTVKEATNTVSKAVDTAMKKTRDTAGNVINTTGQTINDVVDPFLNQEEEFLPNMSGGSKRKRKRGRKRRTRKNKK